MSLKNGDQCPRYGCLVDDSCRTGMQVEGVPAFSAPTSSKSIGPTSEYPRYLESTHSSKDCFLCDLLDPLPQTRESLMTRFFTWYRGLVSSLQRPSTAPKRQRVKCRRKAISPAAGRRLALNAPRQDGKCLKASTVPAGRVACLQLKSMLEASSSTGLLLTRRCWFTAMSIFGSVRLVDRARFPKRAAFPLTALNRANPMSRSMIKSRDRQRELKSTQMFTKSPSIVL
jgi:hypothetical protein